MCSNLVREDCSTKQCRIRQVGTAHAKLVNVKNVSYRYMMIYLHPFYAIHIYAISILLYTI